MTETVWDIKKRIMNECAVPIFAQTLIYVGKVLNDDNKLVDEGVSENATLFLVVKWPLLTNGEQSSRSIDCSSHRAWNRPTGTIFVKTLTGRVCGLFPFVNTYVKFTK